MTTAKRIWLFGDYNQAESRVVAWRGPVKKLKQWYSEGRDVHLETTLLIAKIVQQNNLKLPQGLYETIPWDAFCDGTLTHKTCAHYRKGSEEREQTKRIIHGYNYKVGKKKVSLILNVPEAVAELLMTIYGKLNPDIAGGYHVWIENEIRRTRMIVTPEPVRFRKVFWDQINDDTYRQAYASYPQIIIASMLNRTLEYCCTIFRRDDNEDLKDQWCAWYGAGNWDDWRKLRDSDVRSPLAILWGGMDVRLNAHDAGGISIPNDPELVWWAATTWKTKGEETIWIEKDIPLVIPIDFKKGPTWGLLEDYKLSE